MTAETTSCNVRSTQGPLAQGALFSPRRFTQPCVGSPRPSEHIDTNHVKTNKFGHAWPYRCPVAPRGSFAAEDTPVMRARAPSRTKVLPIGTELAVRPTTQAQPRSPHRPLSVGYSAPRAQRTPCPSRLNPPPSKQANSTKDPPLGQHRQPHKSSQTCIVCRALHAIIVQMHNYALLANIPSRAAQCIPSLASFHRRRCATPQALRWNQLPRHAHERQGSPTRPRAPEN